jgi:uncharacterized membrane protein required for colicin V production
MGALYQLLVVIALIWGGYRGYKRGFTGQIASLLGMAFGVVGARLLAPDLTVALIERYPSLTEGVDPLFLPGVMATAMIYLCLVIIFRLLDGAVHSIMAVFGKGVLNGVAGIFMGVTRYAMIVSIFYNMVIGFDNKSVLLKYAEDNDGNLSEVVMLLSPTLLGCESYEQLAHKLQMHEASKISGNFRGGESVAIIENNKYDVKGQRLACRD